LFTFWPPGPPLLLVLNANSAMGILIECEIATADSNMYFFLEKRVHTAHVQSSACKIGFSSEEEKRREKKLDSIDAE
jgi:hypothetical protein